MDMSPSASASMPMSSMQIVFYTSTTTPLYSNSWTPSTSGQYAGTCIFLIALATIFRALFAVRAVQERRWQLIESKRRYIIAGAEGKEKEDKLGTTGSVMSVSSKESDEKNTTTSKGKTAGVRPWRITQDVPRACLDVVIAGVGYLL